MALLEEKDGPASAKIQILIMVISGLLVVLYGVIAYAFLDFKNAMGEDRQAAIMDRNTIKLNQEKAQVALISVQQDMRLMQQTLSESVVLAKTNRETIEMHRVNHPDQRLQIDITQNKERIEALRKFIEEIKKR